MLEWYSEITTWYKHDHSSLIRRDFAWEPRVKSMHSLQETVENLQTLDVWSEGPTVILSNMINKRKSSFFGVALTTEFWYILQTEQQNMLFIYKGRTFWLIFITSKGQKWWLSLQLKFRSLSFREKFLSNFTEQLERQRNWSQVGELIRCY